MYQTLVSSATSVSRIAGPVCITRFAIRPAKSFWKNAQDWRIRYQWFCHLIRFDTLAEIAWLAIRFCAVSASGRAISSTNAMPRRCGQNFANSSWGLARSDQGNDPSHEHGNRRVEQRHHQPGGEQCSEQALRLAGEVPEERDKTGRGHRLVG